MQTSIQFPYKMLQAYTAYCKPLCQEVNLPQTAFDILMFLANNPEFNTAGDIVKIRKIKANLVSVNVERLVQEGYLERKSVPGDRRKTFLVCTGQSQAIIEQGRGIQAAFFKKLFENVSEDACLAFQSVLCAIDKNLDQMMKGLD
ncbi:MAG: winged helix-turn-helix transcriptional regulator [Lachnospiraceae bacterium]|nr:winged helix-turn-helix transcriptional regulator [Lachnospiraceae bacterium]